MSMIESSDDKLIVALRRVEQCGDIAPPSDHSPRTISLRHAAVRADLMRWDAFEGRYYLTTGGFARLRRTVPPSAILLPFPTNRASRERMTG